MPRVRSIVFDAGETLFDESRLWAAWADWLSIPRFTFMAVLGAVIAQGQHHTGVFEVLRPGIDIERERRARLEKGDPDGFELRDLYPDAIPTLKLLKEEGYKVGVVGNQSSGFTSCLAQADVELDLLATSEDLGAEKPAGRFFTRIVEELGLLPGEIAYVGDRIDNDVYPADEAGLIAVLLRRGPWAYIQEENRPIPRRCINSLQELSELLRHL